MLMAAPAIKGIDLFKIAGRSSSPPRRVTVRSLGIVPIALQRFKQSGVSVVECPGCGRAWTLSPGGGVLRFKAHPRRKTNTPATSWGWTRGLSGIGFFGAVKSERARRFWSRLRSR